MSLQSTRFTDREKRDEMLELVERLRPVEEGLVCRGVDVG